MNSRYKTTRSRDAAERGRPAAASQNVGQDGRGALLCEGGLGRLEELSRTPANCPAGIAERIDARRSLE